MVQAMAALSAHGTVAPAVIHDRIDYAASMIDGRTVQETDPTGRSAAEMGELWEFVRERLHGSKKARKEAAAWISEPPSFPQDLLPLRVKPRLQTICRGGFRVL
jgi:hypothetical protein